MNANAKRRIALLLALVLLAGLTACQKAAAPAAETAEPGSAAAEEPDPAAQPEPPAEETSAESEPVREGYVLELSGDSAKLDGEVVELFDYTWHCDPGVSHDEVKNAPAEYYTGTKPETDAAVYIDHELYYFPELPESGFRKVRYDGEMEYAYYYTDGEHEDYIFATLPVLGNELPSQMMHSEEEAAANQVLHITKPGTYILQGEWKGQILVDLGDPEETFTDKTAKVTVILSGADITCDVAPGVVFASAYECDNEWESRENYTNDVDTSDAGVTVILADGSENTVTGTNVFRMLKTKYKDEASSEEIKTQKKMRKTDAAFYSCVTMQILGERENTGTLTVNSGFEGLDSELHLALNGGRIFINSDDDGINVNEDNVSVVSFQGSDVTINAAQGAEGDGVDSNGFINVNGGTIRINGIRVPDSALDSECGITYNGGTVVIDGEEQTYEVGSTFRETGRMEEGPGGPGGMPFGRMEDFDVREFKEKVAQLPDDATWEDVMALFGFGGVGGQQRPEPPAGMDFSQQPPAWNGQDGQQSPELPEGQMPGGMGGSQQPPQKP